ncbi:ABC transporter permease [Georgenia sp. AZ-5]|uniref:ABC transporter permease n=1 Tax=Georgenia sp. AZ-5 TaxID=3367526 RepID=UPI00375432F7
MTVGTSAARPEAEATAAAASGHAGEAQAALDAAEGARPWRTLLRQPALIAVALVAYFVWLATADLSETERRPLSWDALGPAIAEHLRLTFVSAALVVVIAVPLGVLLTRGPFRRLSGPVIALANIGQAAPSIGLIVLLAMWLGFGPWTAVVALVAYAVLPVLRNTMVGLGGVERRLVEAGRGMGMTSLAVLLRVELPLAVPVILAGVRTALVLLVGTATLAVFINGGGLGILITTGINLYLPNLLVSGALLVALLALLIDWLGRVVEHVARPRGL